MRSILFQLQKIGRVGHQYQLTAGLNNRIRPNSLHLSLGRSLEGILKHPGQTLGNIQVKPCETPRDTQHTMYS